MHEHLLDFVICIILETKKNGKRMLYSSTTTAENGNNLIIELYTITSMIITKKICKYQLLSESLQEKNAKKCASLI